jgi:hypothetical protein
MDWYSFGAGETPDVQKVFLLSLSSAQNYGSLYQEGLIENFFWFLFVGQITKALSSNSIVEN